MNSNLKENNTQPALNESLKRRRNEENKMSENSKTLNNDSTLMNEVTVYEDNSDIIYFNKSSKKRLLNASQGQRSPLASLNKTLPSANQQAHCSKSKILDESYYRKLESKPMPSDPFAMLSDEILLHIFQYLPKKALSRLACVNERFSRVVQDETLWIRMDLGNRALRRGSIGKILSRGLIILRLAQARIQSPLFESHFQLQGYQSKLQYLDLSMASIDQTSLAQLLSTCRILKKLSLEQLEIDIDVCKEVAENKSLEVLNLTMCVGLNEQCIEILMAKLKALSALNVAWTELSGDSVQLLVNNISPSLMRFNIAGSRRTVNDSSIQLLISRCPNIVELDVSDCTMLTSTSLQAFATLTKLEYLSVSRCYNIPMASYLVLNNVKSLIYLDVFGLLSESGLQMFQKTFKHIGINKFLYSSVARATILPRRTSIWGLRTRD